MMIALPLRITMLGAVVGVKVGAIVSKMPNLIVLINGSEEFPAVSVRLQV